MEDGGQSDAVASGNLQQVRRKARTGSSQGKLSLQSSKVIFLTVIFIFFSYTILNLYRNLMAYPL